MRPYVKHVDSGHVSEFNRMSDEELDAFTREAVKVKTEVG
jgi:hypothetical protein